MWVGGVTLLIAFRIAVELLKNAFEKAIGDRGWRLNFWKQLDIKRAAGNVSLNPA